MAILNKNIILTTMTPLEQLQNAVNNEAVCLFSPTKKAKLIRVGKLASMWEVVPPKYSTNNLEYVGRQFTLDNFTSYTFMFGKPE